MTPSRRSAAWHQDTGRRRRFERGAKQRCPSLRGGPAAGGANYTYTAEVAVPHYETRKVQIEFRGRSKVPLVLSDGPTDSPHRYHGLRGELCMWEPNDPVEQRWVLGDGLDRLLGHIEAHLFREAWWREHGEWLGEEAPHGPVEQIGEAS